MTNHHQNDSILDIVGRNLRRWREFREMSGETLARAVKMEKSQISKIENGRSPALTLHTMAAIAKALSLPFEQLIFANPQTIVDRTQPVTGNGIAYGTKNKAADAAAIAELRQQPKTKDEHIKFLQSHFAVK